MTLKFYWAMRISEKKREKRRRRKHRGLNATTNMLVYILTIRGNDIFLIVRRLHMHQLFLIF